MQAKAKNPKLNNPDGQAKQSKRIIFAWLGAQLSGCEPCLDTLKICFGFLQPTLLQPPMRPHYFISESEDDRQQAT